MKNLIVCFILFTLLSPVVSAQDGNNRITVHVINVKSAKGKIYVGLYDKDQWLRKPFIGEIGAIHDGRSTIILNNVPSGKYGISIYHDENDNGTLDTGWFGIPKEPYACSNQAIGRFGPPKWNDAVFNFTGSDMEHIISL